MCTAIRNLLVDVIKQQTALSQESNPIPEQEPKPSEIEMSERAKTAKHSIEQSEFDDSEKETLAELSSLFLDESVKVDLEDEDEDEDGKQLSDIYLYTLLVALKNGDDRRNTDYEKNAKILKTTLDIDNLYTDPVPRSDEFDDLVWGGLAEDGDLNYCFCDNELYDKAFRFATDHEIEEFVRKLPEKSVRFWLTPILITARACRFPEI